MRGLALSHFADRERALAEVLRVTRPEGVLVASAWAGGCSFPTAGASELLADYFAEARDLLATHSLAWTFALNFYLASRL